MRSSYRRAHSSRRYNGISRPSLGMGGAPEVFTMTSRLCISGRQARPFRHYLPRSQRSQQICRPWLPSARQGYVTSAEAFGASATTETLCEPVHLAPRFGSMFKQILVDMLSFSHTSLKLHCEGHVLPLLIDPNLKVRVNYCSRRGSR